MAIDSRSWGAPFACPAPLDRAGSSTSTLATLPEVLTVSEAAAILRVGRNQLYQAVASGQLGALHIGRSIRIPKTSPAGPAHPGQPPDRQRR
jgi:excisionase family DNA binding protein